MDSRIYFHQHRRPRYSNPTYLSTNVQNSMTFFHGGHNPDNNSHRQAPPRYNFEPEYRQKQPNTPIKSYRASQEKVSNTQLPEINPRANKSNLSNYGQRYLNLDQKEIYHKQSSPYNIITLKPKEFSDDIRQYPWYSIENRNDVYYRRMQQAYNQKAYYGSRARTFEKPATKQIAGKQTYDLQPKMSINPERKPNNQRFTAKMLNHMDELQHSLA